MKKSFVILQLLFFVIGAQAEVPISKRNNYSKTNTRIGPMRYQHSCHLIKGESPWKTFHFAPSVNPETVELAAMVTLLIADWSEPDIWKVPHHSLKVHLYPVNDFMVSAVDISGLDLNEENSYIGEFTELKGATAFVIFVSDSKKVILRYQYWSVNSTKESVREAIYECEHPNPKFNPYMWVENKRFGETVQNLIKRVRASGLQQ